MVRYTGPAPLSDGNSNFPEYLILVQCFVNMLRKERVIGHDKVIYPGQNNVVFGLFELGFSLAGLLR